ncbi:MAG TPA: NifB/NifX family molybdenum-iron cluster-binding protein [Methanosarcina sp.]|jgi:predicted Fe-Mo cluster-binding NifX family protein
MNTGYTPLNGVEKESSEIFKVAVTSKSGKLVDQHFGQTTGFMIFEVNGDDYKFLEMRSIKKYCNGVSLNELNNQHHVKTEVLKIISDCGAVLSMKIGLGAQKRLEERGIYCVEYCYTVERGLKYLQIIRRKKKANEKIQHTSCSQHTSCNPVF